MASSGLSVRIGRAALPPPQGFGARERIRLAKSACQSCPVRRDRLSVVLRADEPLGIRGGLRQADRKIVGQRVKQRNNWP
ncbi:WhiB family transcriptional regulator [Streptomyces sp. NPDC054841]